MQLGIGFLGVALAFGLTVLTMAYAVGHVSGAHFNPAVTIGLAVGKRFEWKDVPAYIAAQVVGGLAAGAALYAIASGKDGFDRVGHMAANGYGAHSPAGYSMTAVLIAEALLTAEPALDAPREHIGSVFGIRPGKRLSPQLRVQFLQHGRLLLCSA